MTIDIIIGHPYLCIIYIYIDNLLSIAIDLTSYRGS